MSIINRIDEFFRLNKNKEQLFHFNKEISLVSTPPQPSFSVGTTIPHIGSAQGLPKDQYNNKTFEKKPLAIYERPPEAKEDNKKALNMNDAPSKKKGGIFKSKGPQLNKPGYYSSSSFHLSSSDNTDDEDDLKSIQESSTEQMVSQDLHKRKDRNNLMNKNRAVEGIRYEMSRNRKDNEEYREDSLNNPLSESKEERKDFKREPKEKIEIKFEDIHQAKSEIYLPKQAAPSNNLKIENPNFGFISKLSRYQDPLKSYKKKKAENLTQIPQPTLKNEEKDGGTGKIQAVLRERPMDLALQLLRNFPLGELSLTAGGSFDQRIGNTCHYLDLCYLAGQDPVQFYYENYRRPQQILTEKRCSDETKLAHVLKEDSCRAALEALKMFPLEELKTTLSGFFDRRYNITHEYLDLCTRAKKDPLQYYNENYTQTQKQLLTNSTAVNFAREQLEKFPIESLIITQKGGFDRRYNATHEYLSLCARANQDPLQYYYNRLKKKQESIKNKEICASCTGKTSASIRDDSLALALEQLKKFPLEELRITLKGFFNMRYNITRMYLDLCSKAKKDPLQFYYENLKR